VPAASAPPHPASSVGGSGQQAGSDKRGARGKGGGKQPPTQAQIAANDAKARLQAQEAELKLLEIAAKKAEAQARFDKAKSDASSVTAASTPRAQGGRGGSDFVTHDQFQAGINYLNGAITKGFDQVFSNQSIAAQQQALTNATLAGFVKMMGTNGTGFSLPAPVSRQIGNGTQEVVEQRKISCGQNAGCDLAVEGSGRFAQSSSQFSHAAGVACGGDAAQSFYRESVPTETSRTSTSQFSHAAGVACGGAAQSFYRESVPTETSHTSTSKFDAAVARWNVKRSPTNGKILQAIRDATPDDNMRCLLLAVVNGKNYGEITKMYDKDVASLLTTRNTPFFQRFFTALSSCGLPPNFDVNVDICKTKNGHGFRMTYLQLSQAPEHVDMLVKTLRDE
jgi:hypothetical protein